jgi:hypothetical protein
MHQRVLDALAAGGFLLIRRHAVDLTWRVSRAANEALRSGRVAPGQHVSWARQLPDGLRDEYIAVRRMMGLDPFEPERITDDHVARARAVHDGSDATMATLRVWPEFESATFETQEELACQLERFVTHDDERRATARRMRGQMLDVFGHRALMQRLLDWIADALRPGKPDC